VSSTEACKRAPAPAPRVELPTASAAANNPDPTVWGEYWKTDLDMAGARILHSVVVRSLPKLVAAMWKVHRLREILPRVSWVLDYNENPITQQRLSHV
jgi:hypothetical protein